nr:UbiA family prenyltransferase [Rhizobium lemnae]
MASSDVSFISHLTVFMSIFMATMVGFLVNDMFDIGKDRAAGKRKPLTTGALSIRTGTFYASGMSVAAIAATAACFGVDAAVYITLIIVCATFYSPVSAAVPLIKGPYTALLVLSPFVFASAIGKIGVQGEIYVALFSFVLFREMALDAVDLDGDLRAGFKTIAFFIGRKFAFALGLLGMLGASAFGAYVFDNSHGQLYMFGGVIVQLAVVILSFWDERKSLSVSRFVLLAGVLAIGFNA